MLAHRPEKEGAVKNMLARAVIMGDSQHHMSIWWHPRFAATDYIGLAFTTVEQRTRWYDALPRCRK